MRRLLSLLTLALILLPTEMLWATAYTASVTGNWNNAATWGGSGIPGNGDTCTINTGVTVTVPSGYQAIIGTSGASATVACTTNGNGKLIIAAGGELVQRGELDFQKGTTLQVNGTLTCNPPDGSIYKILWLGTGTSPATLTVNGSAGNNAILRVTPQGTTGKCWTDANTNSVSLVHNWNYFTFSGWGSSSQRAVFFSVAPFSNAATSITNGLFTGNGEINIANGNATGNFTVDAVDFRNCVDVSGTSNGNTCATFTANADATTGVRSFTRITAANTTAKAIYLMVRNAKIGASVAAGDASDIPGIISYNTRVTSGGANGLNLTYKSLFMVADVSAQDFLVPYSLSNTTVRDSVFYTHFANPHSISEQPTGALTQNFYLNNVCDGDGYFSTDAGDMVIAKRAATVSGNVNVNRCGTLFTLDNSASALIAKSNTLYGSYAGSVGETGAGSTILQVFRNNLIANPVADNVPAEKGGIWQPSAFISQTSLSLDYNAFYGTMNATNLTNATLGGAVSYVGPASYQAWIAGSTYGTTDGFGTHDLNVDPQFKGCTSGGTTNADNCTLAKWDTNNGGAGTIASVGAEIIKLNGVDKDGNAATFNSNYSVTNALSYIRTGFTPQNVALDGAGSPTDGSPDIGAMDYQAPASTMVPRRHRGVWQ